MLLFLMSLALIVMLGLSVLRSESHMLLPRVAASLSVIYSGGVAKSTKHLLRV